MHKSIVISLLIHLLTNNYLEKKEKKEKYYISNKNFVKCQNFNRNK